VTHKLDLSTDGLTIELEYHGDEPVSNGSPIIRFFLIRLNALHQAVNLAELLVEHIEPGENYAYELETADERIFQQMLTIDQLDILIQTVGHSPFRLGEINAIRDLRVQVVDLVLQHKLHRLEVTYSR